jgi:hypothetical protein
MSTKDATDKQPVDQQQRLLELLSHERALSKETRDHINDMLAPKRHEPAKEGAVKHG